MDDKKHLLQVLARQLVDAIERELYAEAALIVDDLRRRIGIEPGEATQRLLAEVYEEEK
jgi:protein-arginine kinase activator protein McsA